MYKKPKIDIIFWPAMDDNTNYISYNLFQSNIFFKTIKTILCLDVITLSNYANLKLMTWTILTISPKVKVYPFIVLFFLSASSKQGANSALLPAILLTNASLFQAQLHSFRWEWLEMEVQGCSALDSTGNCTHKYNWYQRNSFRGEN